MSELQDLNRKLREFPGNKYYRVYIDAGNSHDLSDTSTKLYSITGYYADEYILPVTTLDRIYKIISDESAFKGHIGVCAVLMPYDDADHRAEKYETALESLCHEYGVARIHFSEIFGQTLLGKRRSEFIQKYVGIVGDLGMWAVSFSTSKAEFLNQLPYPDVSDRELYFILYWNVVEHIVESLPTHSIFHLYFEQDNNLSINLATEYIGKLHDGLRQCQSLRDRQSSICKHPLFFSKKALLFSSLSDLAAYSNNILQKKLDQGIPPAKIRKNHGELIETARLVFKNYTSLYQAKLGADQLVLGKI